MQELLKNYGAALAGARVLDFGSGTGLLTEHLVAAGATVHAVDTSPAMIEVLDAKIAEQRWTKVTTSAERPATTPQYDLIVCSSVCSFLDDYPATVTALVALIQPAGLFVQWDWEREDGDTHGLSKAEINSALTDAGLIGVSVNAGFSISIDDQTLSPLMGYGQRPHNG
ncbi:MAG: class I SAM-dependent methyltransferase [Acidimicrobiales bacterium]